MRFPNWTILGPLLALMLPACSPEREVIHVPVVQPFPEMPAELRKPCEPLAEIPLSAMEDGLTEKDVVMGWAQDRANGAECIARHLAAVEWYDSL